MVSDFQSLRLMKNDSDVAGRIGGIAIHTKRFHIHDLACFKVSFCKLHRHLIGVTNSSKQAESNSY